MQAVYLVTHNNSSVFHATCAAGDLVTFRVSEATIYLSPLYTLEKHSLFNTR